MRITIESTTREVEIHHTKGRVWQGTTDNGLSVVVIVALGMAVGPDDATLEQLAEAGIHHAPYGPLTSIEPNADAAEAFPDAVPFTGWPLTNQEVA